MFRNYIFDWSGTVVDDLGPVVDGTNRVYREHGLEELDRESFRRDFTLPYDAFWARVLPHVSLDEVERLFREGFDASPSDVPLIPHAREFIEAAAASGARLFVLSSIDSGAFERQATALGLSGHFTQAYTGVLEKRAVIGQMLTDHKMTAAETCFIGDMSHDVETAQHAGVTSIAVATGYFDAERLAKCEPDLLVPNLSVLQPWVGMPARAAEPPQILIRGLEVNTRIGVPAEERATPQMLWLDLAIDVEEPFGSMDDAIDKTIDYHALSLDIADLAGQGERQLIETLADEVADLTLGKDYVSAVEVTIRKKILPYTEYVGCRVKKQR